MFFQYYDVIYGFLKKLCLVWKLNMLKQTDISDAVNANQH